MWGLTLDWAGAFGNGDLKADLRTCSAPTTLSTLGSRAFLLRSKLHTKAWHCQELCLPLWELCSYLSVEELNVSAVNIPGWSVGSLAHLPLTRALIFSSRRCCCSC